MVVDIEKEYCNYICDKWSRFSDEIIDIVQFHDEKHDDTYEDISKRAIRFLQDKLKDLETRKN